MKTHYSGATLSDNKQQLSLRLYNMYIILNAHTLTSDCPPFYADIR